MIGVIVALREGRSLAPLTDDTCPALLPVAGKAAIDHAVEALVSTGIRRVAVVVSPHADLVERHLGDGARWGVRIDWLLARGDETGGQIARRVRAVAPHADLLVVRGDSLVAGDLEAFAEGSRASGHPHVAAVVDGGATGAWWIRAEAPIPAAAVAGADGTLPDATGGAVLPLAPGRFAALDSLADYLRANLDAVAGAFPGLRTAGREIAPGVRIGAQSRVPARSVGRGGIVVGERCAVMADARLADGVVLGDDVVVDRGAEIHGSVVLPRTYVGEMVEIRDAIVRGSEVIHVGRGTVTCLEDGLVSAALSPGRESAFVAAGQRLLGLAALAMSLPLWPAMLAASLAADARRPLRRVVLRGNAPGGGRRDVTALEAATPIPVLRRLPRLLAVVRGDLRLVGVEPMRPGDADARIEDWQRTCDEAPAGVVEPACLELGPDAPADERRVVEAFYARTRTTAEDFRWLGRGLREIFRSRAWAPARTS